MSALPAPAPECRSMRPEDLDAVCGIEARIYAFPWTRGNFADSLGAGYCCSVLLVEARIAGYAVMSVGAGESHLLNLSIDARLQRRGYGRALLLHQIDLARRGDARIMLLEVRPSNAPARALYRDIGFQQISVRRGYYPAAQGREDALLLALSL